MFVPLLYSKAVYITVSERANLTNPLPQRVGQPPVTVDLLDYYIDRWNRTREYWLQCITSLSDVPAGGNTNFIPYDTYVSRW